MKLRRFLTFAVLFSVGLVTAQDYPTNRYGETKWTLTNLNVTKFRDGTAIQEAKTDREWSNMLRSKTPCWAYYNYDAANARYGKLYNYYAIIDQKGLAPKGYHIPNHEEYKALVAAVSSGDKDFTIGRKLKSKDGWTLDSEYETKHPNGTDEVGFHAMAGGFIKPNATSGGAYCQAMGEIASFWVKSEKPAGMDLTVYYDHYQFNRASFHEGRYIRLVKSTPEQQMIQEAYNIGDVYWMRKNLSKTKYNNGDEIKFAADKKQWAQYCSEGVGCYCFFRDDRYYGDRYGFLYNKYAIEDPRGIAPAGWQLPDADMINEGKKDRLFRNLFVDGGSSGGNRLSAKKFAGKTGGMTLWRTCEGRATGKQCSFWVYSAANMATAGNEEGHYVRLVKKGK